MTEYVILEQTHNDGSEVAWRQRGHMKARSARSAVSAYLENSKSGGTFIATPSRSWRPIAVEVETKTQLKFS